MKYSTAQPAPRMTLLKTALCLVFLSSSVGSFAGENFRLRQSPMGAFGGEIAAPADKPGLLGTAALTTLEIANVVDGNGFDITAPITAKLTAPLAAYTLPGSGLNPTNLANAAASAKWAGSVAAQNVEVSGLGDAELSAVWIRHQDRLKVAAGVSLFVPTGVYDKKRGPHPGFGNFYTLRPGVAVTYNLNPNYLDDAWDAGVTVAGRISNGINSTNSDTDSRSGNFIYTEVGVVKVAGHWAFGANLLSTQHVTDDTSPVVGTNCLGSVDAAGCRVNAS